MPIFVCRIALISILPKSSLVSVRPGSTVLGAEEMYGKRFLPSVEMTICIFPSRPLRLCGRNSELLYSTAGLLAANRIALQKILQRNQSAVTIPKSHMPHTGNERPLTTGNQLSQTAGRSHRCTAASIDVVVFTAQYQRRHFDLRRFSKRVPGETRLFVQPKLLHSALPGPEG